MSARVLVVDDIPANVKLLEAMLSAEYFDVITAVDGEEALEKAQNQSPDIILLDIMMPGMDGFEVCEKLKADVATSNIPVVMVTALTDIADRVKGLQVGADDFLSKPVNDIALMSRVRSLVRLKMTVDEWQVRENTARELGFTGSNKTIFSEASNDAKVLIVEDKAFEANKIVETLGIDADDVTPVRSAQDALEFARTEDFDLIIVSLTMSEEDGLRLCSQLRASERSRATPILAIAEDVDMKLIARALEVGAHDYILRPVDKNEFLARARTQIRRKRYQDRLRQNYEQSLSLALIDSLTGLYNRRYLMVHLEKMISKNAEAQKTMCVLMMDIDKFKMINDIYGHSIGDEVLKTFSSRISESLRSFDLVVRLGGEEFFVVLPDINEEMSVQVAERLRKSICDEPFKVSIKEGFIDVSVSIGGALILENTPVDDVLKQADDELYKAKEDGRNRVYFADKGLVGEAAENEEPVLTLEEG